MEKYPSKNCNEIRSTISPRRHGVVSHDTHQVLRIDSSADVGTSFSSRISSVAPSVLRTHSNGSPARSINPSFIIALTREQSLNRIFYRLVFPEPSEKSNEDALNKSLRVEGEKLAVSIELILVDSKFVGNSPRNNVIAELIRLSLLSA